MRKVLSVCERQRERERDSFQLDRRGLLLVYILGYSSSICGKEVYFKNKKKAQGILFSSRFTCYSKYNFLQGFSPCLANRTHIVHFNLAFTEDISSRPRNSTTLKSLQCSEVE